MITGLSYTYSLTHTRYTQALDVEANKVDADYLYYCITQDIYTEYLAQIADTNVSSYPAINPSDLGNMKIWVIEDIPTQRKIGSFLRIIDSKIENNNRINAELEAMARTLYEYWFVQFEFPDAEGKPYKSNGGKMVWNDMLKQEIPNYGQYKADILSLIAYIKKIGFNPYNNKDKIIEHYSIPAYDSSLFPIFEKGRNVSSNKYCVSRGDILVSKLNPQFKRVWDPYCLTDTAVCSTEFIVFHCLKDNCRSYLLSLIKSDRFRKLLVNNSSSSTGSRKRLSPEDTLNFAFAIPDECLQIKYHSFVGPNYEKIKNNIIENHSLAVIRDFLVSLLMNGQVTIRSS